MSWIFDINFKRSLQAVRERKYLELIRDALPQSEKALKLYSIARLHLENTICNLESINESRV